MLTVIQVIGYITNQIQKSALMSSFLQERDFFSKAFNSHKEDFNFLEISHGISGMFAFDISII